MSYGEQAGTAPYKGVRRRKWGKWVSEIRVPGSQARLWLGSYVTPEAAAVAHDVASYCLHRPETLASLNFPLSLPLASLQHDMSPRSVQRVASDAGMAVDAGQTQHSAAGIPLPEDGEQNGGVSGGGGSWSSDGEDGALSISVEDYL